MSQSVTISSQTMNTLERSFHTVLYIVFTSVLNAASSNNTTLPDDYSTWRDTHALGQSANQDHDEDGVLNGIEYFMGESGNKQTVMPTVINNSMTWPMASTYAGNYGSDFVVQTSKDLSSWAVAPEGKGAVTVSVNPSHSVTYTLPTEAANIFVRLHVTIAKVNVSSIPYSFFDSVTQGDSAEEWRPVMKNPPVITLSTASGVTGTIYQPFVAGVQQSAYNHFQFRGGVFVRGGLLRMTGMSPARQKSRVDFFHFPRP